MKDAEWFGQYFTDAKLTTTLLECFVFCARTYFRRSGANLIWSGRCSRNALKSRTRASQTPSLGAQFSEWPCEWSGCPGTNKIGPKLAEGWDVSLMQLFII